jgi:hypothetical protein
MTKLQKYNQFPMWIRPPVYTKPFALRLTKEADKKIRKMSERVKKSLNDLINTIIMEYKA